MSKYFIDRFVINKNGNRQRVFYTGLGISFSSKIEDALLFDKLARAKESVKYLNDCNMHVYVVEVTESTQCVVYPSDQSQEGQNES